MDSTVEQEHPVPLYPSLSLSVRPTASFPRCPAAVEYPIPPARLGSALGDWMQTFPWQWFVSLTFRRQVPVDGMLKTWSRWMNKLNRERFGNRYALKGHRGIRRVRVIETQPSLPPHIHALLLDCEQLSIPDALKDWGHLAGSALITPYDKDCGGAHYLAKVYKDAIRGKPTSPGALDFEGEWAD